jgi:CSLREA domain-containing protein
MKQHTILQTAAQAATALTQIGGSMNRRLMMMVMMLGLLGGAVATARAAVYTVTNTADSGAGSLRDAISQANASPDNDTINTSVTGTITLGGTELTIDNNGTLTINGPGANQLTVSGNNASRVFSINGGANATISGITITGGNISGASGGGIYNQSGTLNLTNCAVSGNTSNSFGGGIYNQSGTVNLTNSTVSGNSSSEGGGIFTNYFSTLNLTNSTVSSNTAGLGGGIYNNGANAATNLINSTISGNSAQLGGGIYAGAASNNQGGTSTSRNSIIANSTGGDCSKVSTATVSFQDSLVENGSCGVTNGVNGNRTGDPLLGPLADNGGTTLTHALLAGSIAIDAGSNALANGLTTDQRGAARIQNSIVDMGAVEYGSGFTYVVTKTADTNDGSCDANDCSLREAIAEANAFSSDDAISFNIPTTDPGYDAANNRYTITLTINQLFIANNGALTINGLGANQLTVSGNDTFRVFSIAPGANATISGLTISRGRTSSGGGSGIYNGGGTVNLTDSIVSGNSSNSLGGGILNESRGTMTITNSTISSNSAFNNVGGIANASGTVNLTNSTVSGNSGTAVGGIYNGLSTIFNLTNSTVSGNSGGIAGGITNSGSMSLTNSTVSGNSSGGAGVGGIYSNYGGVFSRNSIIANSIGGDCMLESQSFSNFQNSLVEDGSCGVTSGVNGNLTGDP